MKVSIRLQNHGCKSHPLWWIVVAPNRKNIKGRFIEHVGYWCPIMYHDARRQAIMNLNRIKYWIGCGAVPTFRVHKLLNEYGLLPKQWYYIKSPEELEKVPEEEIDDKKKRKIEAKEKRKQKEGEPMSHFNHLRFVKPPRTYQRSHKKLFLDVMDMVRLQEKENDMLRAVLMQAEFKQLQMVKKLSPDPQSANLRTMQDNLKKLQSELVFLQKNSIHLHPVKRSMLMEKINELMPKVYQLEREQEQEIDESEAGLQDTILRRKVMHEVMVKRLKTVTEEIDTYYKMLEPLTKETYLEFLIKDVGMDYDDAYKQAEEDFEEYAEAGYPPTKGDLFRDYNLDARTQTHPFDYELNPLLLRELADEDPYDNDQDVVEGEKAVEGEGEEVEEEAGEVEQAQEQVVAEGEESALGEEGQMSEEQLASFMANEAEAGEQSDRSATQRFLQNYEGYLDPRIHDLKDPKTLRMLVRERHILLPVGNPVNPYPDLKSYIPEEYYDFPKNHEGLVEVAPAYFPEQELLRYREKMRSKKQHEAADRT